MAAELGHLARGAATILCLLIFHVAPSDSQAQVRISGGNGTCISRERGALMSFKASLLDPAGRLLSWQGEDCCQWEGVWCSSRTSHVIKLDLRYTYMPDYYALAFGYIMYNNLSLSRYEMSSSLAALRHLRYLDLSGNDFNGTSIPVFVGSMENLRYLNLSSSQFSGRIPSQLGNLSKLQCLDISGNHYYDISSKYYHKLHTEDLAWLERLQLLSNLDMSDVDLSPVWDWVYRVDMLSSLRVIRLVDCGLTSTLSGASKSNLTHLKILDLSSNLFKTSLENNWFWDLTSLKELHLSRCEWHGPIPEELGNMTSLQVIDFSENDLVGLIPSNLENLCNLEVLRLDANNINMSIGEFMDRLPRCSWSIIQVLSLEDTNMTGKLPIWIGNMISLIALDVRGWLTREKS